MTARTKRSWSSKASPQKCIDWACASISPTQKHPHRHLASSGMTILEPRGRSLLRVDHAQSLNIGFKHSFVIATSVCANFFCVFATNNILCFTLLGMVQRLVCSSAFSNHYKPLFHRVKFATRFASNSQQHRASSPRIAEDRTVWQRSRRSTDALHNYRSPAIFLMRNTLQHMKTSALIHLVA